MVGAGFSGNAFEGALNITENYPSATNAWSVTVDNTTGPSWAQVTVSVYCLQADYSIATIIVHASGTGTTAVSCPTGSALVSGGYTSGGGVSAPNGNGWEANATDAYALCATRNFIPAPSTSAKFISPDIMGENSVGTASCGTGQLSTGGGFTSFGVPIIGSNGTSTSWSITAAAAYTPTSVTAWAVCVYPPTTGIHIAYHVNGQWPGGFSTTIAITNKSTIKIQGWKLQFSFPGDQMITQLWNGNFSQSGQQVTILNMSYDGTIEPGQTLTLGFNGTWKLNNIDPTTCLFVSLHLL